MKKLIKLFMISTIIYGSSVAFGAPRKTQATAHTRKPVVTQNHVLIKEYSYRDGNRVVHVKEYASKQQTKKHISAPPKRKPKHYNKHIRK